MLKFSEMDDEVTSDGEEGEEENFFQESLNKGPDPYKVTCLKRSTDVAPDSSEKKKRKVGKIESKTRKEQAGEVLESRTRKQAAAVNCGQTLTSRKKNATCERELGKEGKKALLQTTRHRSKAFEGNEKRTPREEVAIGEDGNDVQEAEIEKETEDDDTRKMFRDKSRTSALRLLWQRRRIEQAKQWSYNSGGKRKRRSRTRRFKVTKSKKSKAALQDPYQYFEGDDTYDFHDDDACVDLPDRRSVPPEMKRMVVNKNSGETVLHRAARLGYEDVVLYCLETGTADINARDNAGYTSLHECCVRGHLNIAKYLIYYGANVNCSATDGTRPLHDAVDNDHLEVGRLLLSYGADPLLATYSGRTPVKAARYPKMRAFMKGYLADLNGPNEDEGEVETPWEFNGSSFYSDPASKSGCVVFSDLPSDPDNNEHDLEIEFSVEPHICSYTLDLENEEGPKNYVLMTDVLDRLKLYRQEFMERHPKICVGTKRIRTSLFCQKVAQSCFHGGDSPLHRSQFLELLPLHNGIRELFDVPVIYIDYISEKVHRPRTSNDEDDLESVMSEDTVIYEADDTETEDNVEENTPPSELKTETAGPGVRPGEVNDKEVSEVELDAVQSTKQSLVEKFEEVESIPPAPKEIELRQDYSNREQTVQERLSNSLHRSRQVLDYYRQVPPKARVEALATERPEPSGNVTSTSKMLMTSVARSQETTPVDSRNTVDLHKAMQRTITHAMQKHTGAEIVHHSRDQIPKPAISYQNIPYMYKTPHHSQMRGSGSRMHPYPLPQSASQQFHASRLHPQQTQSMHPDYYQSKYRHSMPQNYKSLYQMPSQQLRDTRLIGNSQSQERETSVEAKNNTDTAGSSYLLKVATTPEEYFLNYKQRLNANSSPQFRNQRNAPALINGVGTPTHQQVAAHSQIRPDRHPPYL